MIMGSLVQSGRKAVASHSVTEALTGEAINKLKQCLNSQLQLMCQLTYIPMPVLSEKCFGALLGTSFNVNPAERRHI